MEQNRASWVAAGNVSTLALADRVLKIACELDPELKPKYNIKFHRTRKEWSIIFVREDYATEGVSPPEGQIAGYRRIPPDHTGC